MQQEVFDGGKDVVAKLRAGLAERIGRDRFDLWFGAQVQWKVDGNTVLVTAPNSFLLDRLKRQFAPDIQLAVLTICGVPARAEFRVDELTAAAGTRSSPSDVPTSAVSTSAVPTSEESRNPVSDSSAGDRPSSSVGTLPLRPAEWERTSRRQPESLPSFVVGTGNRVAYTAAQSVVERPGSVSPLFVFGPAGCGKTHLLEGICSVARGGPRNRRALMLSAEQFTCHFLEALQGSGLPNFRRKCREVDLLAIDDLQFLAGKKATLIEFLHTLDTLGRKGRQLVVAADRSPAELSILGSEVATRLAGGLVCPIDAADYDTRLGIARQFVTRRNVAVPDDVLELIASETSGDARQIHGAINRLSATSEALHEPIALPLACQALPDIFASAQRPVRLSDVERAVCEVFGMDSKALRDGNKTKAISHPRMLAMWLARKHTRAAFSEIGQYFGKRSHSTVISAERKVNKWVADGAKLQLGHACWPVDEALRRVQSKLRTG